MCRTHRGREKGKEVKARAKCQMAPPNDGPLSLPALMDEQGGAGICGEVQRRPIDRAPVAASSLMFCSAAPQAMLTRSGDGPGEEGGKGA
jgi:hypothetical protein